MVLIVDSGSSKSDWVLLENQRHQSIYETMGFNPVFHDKDAIVTGILESKNLLRHAPQVKQIFYYGAGCSNKVRNAVVEGALSQVFPNADIQVDHDLLACAYATYTGVPAISCILGTGSNSCHFDGHVLSEGLPALGYVLGDEGSGAYFGKKLLAAHLYKQLPLNISLDLEQSLDLDKERIIEQVYKQPNANVFLASCMPFIAKHKEDPFINQMLSQGFTNFMEVHVSHYPDYKKVPVHFIGSIAHFFEEELRRAASDLGLTVGSVIRKPIYGLVSYHLQHGALILDA